MMAAARSPGKIYSNPLSLETIVQIFKSICAAFNIGQLSVERPNLSFKSVNC